MTSSWCDLCDRPHDGPHDGPAYDLDGWRPESLIEVVDALEHAKKTRVLSAVSHHALDKLLAHTVRLLASRESCSLYDTALAGQILMLYNCAPKWYG